MNDANISAPSGQIANQRQEAGDLLEVAGDLLENHNEILYVWRCADQNAGGLLEFCLSFAGGFASNQITSWLEICFNSSKK